MKIFRCIQSLSLPRMDRQGNRTGADLQVTPGMVFTVYDDQADVLQLEGLQGLRLNLSRKTVDNYFEEMA